MRRFIGIFLLSMNNTKKISIWSWIYFFSFCEMSIFTVSTMVRVNLLQWIKTQSIIIREVYNKLTNQQNFHEYLYSDHDYSYFSHSKFHNYGNKPKEMEKIFFSLFFLFFHALSYPNFYLNLKRNVGIWEYIHFP